MTVALGTYAGTATLIERLGGTAAMGTADNALLLTICEQVNTYIEQITGRVLAPIASGTVTFDVDEATQVLYAQRGNALKDGIRAITSLEVAAQTGGTYTSIGTADYYLRPKYPRQGWPYTEIWLSDIPTGSYSAFPEGFETVRVVCSRGWAETPEDIEDVALTLAVRTWHARQASQADRIGTDEMGAPLVSRFLSARDRETLYRYTLQPISA